MKALFVTHSFPRFDGDAAGSFILRLAVALAGRGVEVRVIAPAAAGLDAESTIQGILVRRFRYAPRAYETLAYRGTMAADVAGSIAAKVALASFIVSETAAVVSAARSFRPDLIHAHWWFPNGVAATIAGRLSSVPVVTTSHGTDMRLLRRAPAAQRLARFVFRSSARVTCVSQWLAVEAAPLCRTAPVVAPMPVAVAQFRPSHDRERNRMIFIGRMSAQKGAESAIRALKLMRPDATLDLVGDGPERDALMALVTDLGLADRVTWHGHVRHDEIPTLLARASVLLAPFVDEGLGLVAAEAQLCETAPIGYASGGLCDVIENDVTGILVEPHDVPALAQAADRVLADDDVRDRLGIAGRAAALARFAPDAVAARYAQVYADTVRRDAE